MFRYRLKERLADKIFEEGRAITLIEVGKATGIGRTTLSRLANQKGYNITMDTLDSLCNYFGCRVEQLVEHIRDD